MFTILVADDDERVRHGVRNLLEAHDDWQVIGEAVNGRDALQKAAELTPELVILDISMPELDGISAAPQIRKALPEAELLVLSHHDAPELVARAFDAGARGYVLKSNASRDLVPAVEAMRRHVPFLSQEISEGHPGLQAKARAGFGSNAAGSGKGPADRT
jgi:DNA-binding NarL/FixJ family response regulator